jgi:hypothetical protein
VLLAGDVFDSSRSLPLLQTLDVDNTPCWRYGHTCLDYHSLQLLVQCCPGLKDLRLGATVEEYADLSPLMQLQQLQQLTALSVCLEFNDKTAQGLAVLTGIKRLTIDAPSLPAVALLWLTKLQNLHKLGIYAAMRQQGPFFGYTPEETPFREVSEELLKHPEVNEFRLHLESRSVSCQVHCQCVHLYVCTRLCVRACLPHFNM